MGQRVRYRDVPKAEGVITPRFVIPSAAVVDGLASQRGITIGRTAFMLLDQAPFMLLPSTPNTPEGEFADWAIYALRSLHSLRDADRFMVLASASLIAFEHTYDTRLTPELATAFIDDIFEGYERFTTLLDPHTARAAFLMACLRAARLLRQ